jgi:hypothetical protein
MKAINYIAPLVVALFCCGFTKEGAWIIDTNSSLTIHGATNINTFTCLLESYQGHDTLQYYHNATTSELQFMANRMSIPIQHFDCGSRQISKDFRKTLKSDAFPYIDIRFISLGGNTVADKKALSGKMDIVIAGVTRRYAVRFKAESKNGQVVLSGGQSVSFADFNLKAPEKLRGMIRVKEVLQVEFYLVLKSV